MKKEISMLKEPTDKHDDEAIEGIKKLLAIEQENLKRMLEEELK